jgi:predicted metalloprotease with PDZ domain
MQLRPLAAVLALLALAGSAPATDVPSLALELSPKPSAEGIGSVAVTLRFSTLPTLAGGPLLRLPLVVSNVDTVASVIGDPVVTDADGAVPITHRDVDLPAEDARDAVAGGPSREWIAGRATRGAVSVRYSVPADATLPPRGAAPPFAWLADGGGASAAGHVFLLLPPGSTAWRTSVSWALPAGMRGVSSLGEGAVRAPEPLRAQELRQSFFMVGRVATWPVEVPQSGFFAAWHGTPPFDAPALMTWTGTLYGHYVRLFAPGTSPTYGVFLRYNPINAGGGVGLRRAFVTTFGRARDGEEQEGPRGTLAHEMFHTFSPYLSQPSGLEASWFGEGLATFYQSALPLRFGMMPPSDFLRSINGTAARYYTSAMMRTPNSEVPKRFWADTRVRTLPYDRGMLFFAELDDAIRKKSAGKRSLDDLILRMLEMDQAGTPTSLAVWEDLVERELGAAAVARQRDILAGGAVPLPASDAFGACFRRTIKPLRRFELGFDSAVLIEPKRIVRGLVPGSAAATAGVRDGDEIVKPVPQDGIQGNQTATMTLELRRAGVVRTVTYLPRGETVDAYQWERIPGVPDGRCARTGVQT